LACLGLSSLFWLLTSLSKDYSEVIRIPVDYQNLPKDMLVINKPALYVEAEVKIFGFDLLWYWLQFDKAELLVEATPNKMRNIIRNGEKIHFVLVNEKKNRIVGDFDNQFQILNLSPDTLFVQLVPLFSKKVPVKLKAEILFEKQFGMVDNPNLLPDSILLSGAKKTIDTINAVHTELEIWKNLSESVTATLQLQKFDENLLVQFSENQVEVELNVVEFTEGRITLPVKIIAENPQRVKVFPQQVDLTYQVPLAAYENIKTEQFQVSVNVPQSASQELLRLTVNVDGQPSHVRQIRVNPPQVEFIRHYND